MQFIFKNIGWVFGVLITILCANHVSAAPVSPERAQKVATNCIRFCHKNYHNEPLQLVYTHYYEGKQQYAMYYAFTIQGLSGFALVAADDRLSPIIGYSDKGTFSMNNPSPEWSFFMRSYYNPLIAYIENRCAPEHYDESLQRWYQWENALRAPTTIPLGPLMTTIWNQNPIYNNLCPIIPGQSNAVTGCVATAMAQIMKYWEFPTTGSGARTYTDGSSNNNMPAYNTISANFGATTYNWDLMPNNLNTANNAQINEVARISFHAGVSVEMDYGTSASSSYIYSFGSSVDAYSALVNNFGYSNNINHDYRFGSTYSGWRSTIDGELDSFRPMIYHGQDTNNGGGHAWVCDGRDAFEHYHMNWGWGGCSDGYYNLDDLNPTVCNDDMNFNDDTGILHYIYPPNCVGNLNITTLPSTVHPEAAHTITASCIVPSGATRAFDAGDLVVLQSGFVAVQGSDFRAYVNGCGVGRPAVGNVGNDASTAFIRVKKGDTQITSEKLPIADALRITAQPNPAQSNTTLIFSLPSDTKVTLSLYNTLGQKVSTILDNAVFNAGTYQQGLDLTTLTSGVYYCILETPAARVSQKLVIHN